MGFEVLTVELKRIQVLFDNNAESTGKSFAVFREERSASIFRACKSKSTTCSARAADDYYFF
jgi:hypothetical protein